MAISLWKTVQRVSFIMQLVVLCSCLICYAVKVLLNLWKKVERRVA